MKSTEVLAFIEKHLAHVPQLLFTKDHVMYNYVLKLEQQDRLRVRHDEEDDLYVYGIKEIEQ